HRAFESGRQCRELGLHQLAGGGRQQMRQCCDRSMRAVGSRERVVDIEVAELGKGPRELRRIRLLALVEAKIFEERHFAWAERRDHPSRLWADAIGRESDLAATDRLLQ